MNSRAVNTEHDAKVDAGPLWLLTAAVSTPVVPRCVKKVQTQGVAVRIGGRGEGVHGCVCEGINIRR